MTKDNNTAAKVTEVTKAGDWVLPVKKQDGTTVYALQINKSKEDKDNFTAIKAEYDNAGIEVLHYHGKNNGDVYLVEASQKLKAQRASVTRTSMVNGLVARFGISEAEAEAVYAEMQAEAKEAKANK